MLYFTTFAVYFRILSEMTEPLCGQCTHYMNLKLAITNLSHAQALLFLLVLAGSTILCGRLCYCISFSLSRVQCYLCKNKVVLNIFLAKHILLILAYVCLFKIHIRIYISQSFDQRTFNICCTCPLYFFFHQIHPTSQGSGIWISAFIEYFSFPRFSGQSGCLGSTESIVYKGENQRKFEF